MLRPEIGEFTGRYGWGPGIQRVVTGASESPEELLREQFQTAFPLILRTTPGGRDELRSKVDPVLQDLVDDLPDRDVVRVTSAQRESSNLWGIDLRSWSTIFEVHDDLGDIAGFVRIQKPAAGMSYISTVASVGDTRHIERMHDVIVADRRPAAILFADLEASSALSRRLPTSEYFALARRLVRAADQCVVEAGGLVGRHLGDGVTAFFLAEVLGSESAAARACIEASRSLRAAVDGIARRSDLEPDDILLRFGLHWGSTLYVGLFKTIARSEVTAMGDEVNEAARIEACATGGRTLASKALVERLKRDDARDLGLQRKDYTLLGDLPTATDKARRDAPSIPVCDV